jgi:gluconokinase
MPVSLLDSQLATLEVPTGEPGVVTVDIDDTIEGIAATALEGLAALGVTG